MFKKILLLLVILFAVTAANSYFLPTITQDIAINSVNGSMADWRASQELKVLILLSETLIFAVFALRLLLPKSK